MKFIYGTSNKGKSNQVKDFFENVLKEKIEILTLRDINFNEEIEENGKTFEENSLIKANAIKDFCNKNNINEIIITDDAGLCVDCLDGRPGVLSARYAGDHAPDDVVLNKLLNEMQDVPMEKRTAMFVCALTAIMKDGKIITTKGITKGKVSNEIGPKGRLTYNPIFIPNGFNKVMSEFSDEELGYTHREKAFIELFEKINTK